jgi:hypothetical protein
MPDRDVNHRVRTPVSPGTPATVRRVRRFVSDPETKAQGHPPRVPRVIALACVLGVALVGVSDALNLYDRIVYWGNLVHAAEGFLVASVAAYLLIAYRDREQPGVRTQLVALMSMLVGVTFGAFWEFLAFVLDWTRHSDLQQSNTNTVTDMLSNDLAAVLGVLVALHAYGHWTRPAVQREISDLAAWLFNPIGRLLDAQGKLLAAFVLLGIAVYVAALWYAERALPFVAPQ